MQRKDPIRQVFRDMRRLIKYLSAFIVCTVMAVAGIVYFQFYPPSPPIEDQSSVEGSEIDLVQAVFEAPVFDDTDEGKLAQFGEKLINETYAHIGPDTDNPVTGNRLSCASCHLDGGRKPFAAPYVGLSGVFPTYIGRENKIESLEERVNGCFERSMNGKSIDPNSTEMRAIITYIKQLSTKSPVGARLEGQGFVDIQVPDRAADPEKGALVYQRLCVSCHGDDGQGLKGTNGHREGGYVYPPLWGDDSYNDGAGMARLLTAARFIKGNMPLVATHDSPMISDEEAYDVAAFINSHSRPQKANKEYDYPDLSKKPDDCPYPPYDDDIPQEQHRLGPFNFVKQ